ncbi:hypothetical protein RhiJN_27502 [Ceratobasidium sp. AG-Ba]|nr:hypothetical protein RhiJN_13439 [Ceratobasidium sp. AG-Ba]QRV99483.1 hypothetical protein RhiJN_27502 [Ceratobasidium sp. AG-Ba]QRW13993.1 hypothetical protein RhiLY_12992 [Ceratobasidium sp. AG-Ba]
MWFTGISGSKANAPTISGEKDLALLVSQLAASKKKPNKITVFIAFDVNDLDAYQGQDNNPTLASPSGTKAASEATHHAPPNAPEFDGPQGLGAAAVKPCRHAATAPAAPSSGTNATSLLIAAMVPLLATLTQSVVGQNSTVPSAPLPPHAPDPPPNPTPSMSALQASSMLAPNGPNFLEELEIDLMDKLEALKHCHLIPNLLLEVPYDDLGGC